MEVYGILSLFDNMYQLSKTDNDKLLVLQHKFVYLMYKKDFLTSVTVRNKVYQQALDILNNGNYQNIHHVVQPFVDYYQTLHTQPEIEIIDFS
jgi:hypothetical protein